jgi:hypothetical protein
MILFTVDSLNQLSEGLVVRLERHHDVKPKILQGHADQLFPNGVSRYGEFYLLRGSGNAVVSNPQIEILFEYVRRACYPDRPSRFQSFFAVESIEIARVFRQQFCFGVGSIWQLTAAKFYKADMSLLTMGTSILSASWFAHEYWKGNTGQATFWEYLVIPPLKINKKVDE